MADQSPTSGSLDGPALCWEGTCLKAADVVTVHVMFGLAEGSTLVVTVADGSSVIAPHHQVPPAVLREFIRAVAQNGHGVRVPKILREE